MAIAFPSKQPFSSTSPLLRFVLLAFALVLLLVQLFHRHGYLNPTWMMRSSDPHFNPAIRDAANSTMGFEKIVVINLPSRADRRDRMSVIAAHTGMEVEYSDGMKGDQVDDKALPPHWKSSMSSGNKGSYRSHVNALRKVVENRYRTAIIMEDDLDWDLAIKDQLLLFAQKLPLIPESQFEPLSRASKYETPNAPYGLDWDILWLGTCMRPDAPPDAISYDDPFSEMTYKLWNTPGGVACSHAYGITYESAKMLLAYALDLDAPWDLHLSDFCKAHVCPLVSPHIIGFHQPAGSTSDSDISTGQPGYRQKGVSIGVKHSALLDLLDNMEPKHDYPPLGQTQNG